jgi:hypothetical protein
MDMVENERVANKIERALQVIDFSPVITILHDFSPIFHLIYQSRNVGIKTVANFNADKRTQIEKFESKSGSHKRTPSAERTDHTRKDGDQD